MFTTEVEQLLFLFLKNSCRPYNKAYFNNLFRQVFSDIVIASCTKILTLTDEIFKKEQLVKCVFHVIATKAVVFNLRIEAELVEGDAGSADRKNLVLGAYMQTED